MNDRSDALVITADDTRHIFEPRSDGRFEHVEKRRTKGGEWREVGSEIVESLSVEDTRPDA